MKSPRILYCHCAHAQVVPPETKQAVLKGLCDADVPFESVADLCEMSARKDPVLKQLADDGAVRIVACYPRAVKWLFAAAGASLDPAATEVLNMRVESGAEVLKRLREERLEPNLPAGKETAGEPARESVGA